MDTFLSKSYFRFGGGLMADIKRKLPFYASDFTDAFHFQTLPVIGFLYFACLTPIVTFGGLLGFATDNNMVILGFDDLLFFKIRF